MQSIQHELHIHYIILGNAMWQITSLTLSTGLIALMCFLMFWAIWQRRGLPGARLLGILVFAAEWWFITAALEDAAVAREQRIFFAKLQYFAIESVPVLWLNFGLEYSRIKFKLNARLRRSLSLLWIFQIITVLLVLTNEQHGWIWSQIRPLGPTLVYEHGFWFWMAAIYNYTLMTAGTVALFYMVFRSPGIYRTQIVIIITGAIFPFLGNVIYLFKLLPPELGDMTPTALMITCIIYTWGIFRYRLFDLVPIARDALVDNMMDGMVVLDEFENVLYLNPAARKILGLAESQISRLSQAVQSFQTVTASEIFSQRPNILEQVRSNQSGELELSDSGGQLRYIKLNIDLLRSEGGISNGKMVLLQDVTTLKLSEERFRSIVNIVPDAIFLVNQLGEIVLANAQCPALFGYSTTEFLGMPIEDLVPERFEGHARLRENYLDDPYPRPMGKGAEIFAQRKDGSQFQAEISLSPMQTPNGVLILAAIRDISERKTAEERLRLQSAALESAATGVVITDINGQIISVNPAFTEITGFDSTEVIGKNPRLLNSGMHNLEFFENMWGTILAGKIWQGETFNLRKDGTLYVEEQTIAPVRDEQGKITHFISTKQDITGRKQAEEMRDQLMHTIIHDLRNPLTSILAALDMLDYWSERLKLEAEPVEILQITRTSSWRMLGLVNTILDLSKMENGMLTLNREPVVLATLVEQIFRIESPLAIRREVLLLNNMPFDLPIVQVDQVLMGRVLQNLIDNALKFTPDGSSVEVSGLYDSQTGEVTVKVTDRGSGIPPDVQNRLFQKFASSSQERGTGLGLAFCRIAVEAHGGRIWAESQPDVGTTFLFTLPVREKSPQQT